MFYTKMYGVISSKMFDFRYSHFTAEFRFFFASAFVYAYINNKPKTEERGALELKEDKTSKMSRKEQAAFCAEERA
jgi:hypothetical protein